MLTLREHVFESWDHTRLFYRGWWPAVAAQHAVILLHPAHEHSARWEGLVERLELPDTAVVAWDARGHGMSPGPRGAADSVATLVRDLDGWVRHLADEHRIPVANVVLVGHGMGAVLAATWVHDYAPRVRGMVLSAPTFRLHTYVPFAWPLLRLRERVLGRGFLASPVRASWLTHDPEEMRRYDQDPALCRRMASNLLLDLFATSTRIVQDAAAIQVPTLVLSAGADWVAQLSIQERFFRRLGAAVKARHVFPNAYHALFHDTCRDDVMERVSRFIQDCQAAGPSERNTADADQRGVTRLEYDRLRQSAAKSLVWSRLGLQTLGRLGRGVALGWRHGFDSGVMLDYVYANEADGQGWLGRSIDRAFLDSTGWQGIRQRRVHLQELLRKAWQALHAQGRRLHVLDVAAGSARYVLDTMARHRDLPVTATLWDYRQVSLDAAAETAQRLYVRERVTLEVGDAFDSRRYDTLRPGPTVAVASGLFELFPDNAPLRIALAGLAQATERGGYLIYTNQPWQPSLDFMAHVLTNREGQPLVMRRRTQAEMDDLVAQAGFERIDMRIDRWGMYTVSLARRVE